MGHKLTLVLSAGGGPKQRPRRGTNELQLHVVVETSLGVTVGGFVTPRFGLAPLPLPTVPGALDTYSNGAVRDVSTFVYSYGA
jgi:hypothetical protein